MQFDPGYLREALSRRGLTYERAAERAKISPKTIVNAATGREVSLRVWLKLNRLLRQVKPIEPPPA